MQAAYTATSTSGGYYFSIFSSGYSKKDKHVILIPYPDNEKGNAVKEALLNNYKFEDVNKS